MNTNEYNFDYGLSEGIMSKTITIRLDDEKYELFKKFAAMDNRAISNFIETATLRYIEQLEYADEEEMAEINSDEDLQQSLKRGRTDVTKNRKRRVT